MKNYTYWKMYKALFRMTKEDLVLEMYGPYDTSWGEADFDDYVRLNKGDLGFDELTEAEARAFKPEAFAEAVA